jgi:hypothetical protein
VTRAADAEARRRGRRRIGTEDLLMGLLTEPGGTASMVLGRDIDAARSASARLDTRALEAVGIRAEAAGPPPSVPRQRGRLTFTAGARSAFVRAVRLAQADRAGKVTAAHLTAGVLSGREPDDAIALVEAMGVDVAFALERATAITQGTD